MAVRFYWEFDAWQLARQFQVGVFALLAASPRATGDLRFATQLREAARGPTKHIAEGFLRKRPAVFIQFLDFAISSLGEADEHLVDGIECGYFAAEACVPLFRLCRRARRACIELKRSQARYIEEQKRRRRDLEL